MDLHYEIVKKLEIGIFFFGLGNFIFEIVSYQKGSFSILSLIGLVIIVIYNLCPKERISDYFLGSSDQF
jgi:hypothetical protein